MRMNSCNPSVRGCGKSEIKPESEAAIAEIANLLKNDGGLKLFTIKGEFKFRDARSQGGASFGDRGGPFADAVQEGIRTIGKAYETDEPLRMLSARITALRDREQ